MHRQKFEVFLDDADPPEHRWRLVGKNGRVIASSDDGFHNEGDCMDNIKLVKNEAADASIVHLDSTIEPSPKPEVQSETREEQMAGQTELEIEQSS